MIHRNLTHVRYSEKVNKPSGSLNLHRTMCLAPPRRIERKPPFCINCGRVADAARACAYSELGFIHFLTWSTPIIYMSLHSILPSSWETECTHSNRGRARISRGEMWYTARNRSTADPVVGRTQNLWRTSIGPGPSIDAARRVLTA